MTFQEDEQKLHEVSDRLDRVRGNSWKKFKGDIINRLISLLLRPYVENYKISSPNAFIEGYPTEFDIHKEVEFHMITFVMYRKTMYPIRYQRKKLQAYLSGI